MGGHRGLGAALPPQHMLPGARRCRRFKPRELDGFVFPSLQDELVVDDVYLRVLVRDAVRSRGVGTEKVLAGSGTGLGEGLALPGDLLVSGRNSVGTGGGGGGGVVRGTLVGVWVFHLLGFHLMCGFEHR